MNEWQKIWNKREVISDKIIDEKEMVLELKRLNGFESVGYELDYDSYKMQYEDTKKELMFGMGGVRSVFEVGCGSGANLYMFNKDGLKVGGIDYSESLIQSAKKVLPDAQELICNDAILMPTNNKYDAILSNSVFSYFEDESYAWKVLELMRDKSNYSMAVLDIHDIDKKDDFLEYRKKTVSDYEERYKNLPKLFYKKDLFLEFAFENNMSVKFKRSRMRNYWNNDFIFNVFMIKE